MLKLFQTTIFVLLIQILANIVFALFTVLLNLDLLALFLDFNIAFVVQNVLIFVVYLLLTFLLSLYFKHSYKYPYKARVLGILLIICYLITFYLDINNEYFIKYFLYIHYPIGSLFRTLISSLFTLDIKFSLIISILSASLGVYLGHKINVYNVRLKKKKLSSLSK